MGSRDRHDGAFPGGRRRSPGSRLPPTGKGPGAGGPAEGDVFASLPVLMRFLRAAESRSYLLAGIVAGERYLRRYTVPKAILEVMCHAACTIYLSVPVAEKWDNDGYAMLFVYPGEPGKAISTADPDLQGLLRKAAAQTGVPVE